ncbi:MAG: dihydroorotase [Chloroflexi bacterium]|nr:dihydroorotase [Chloroflexota bacterium]
MDTSSVPTLITGGRLVDPSQGLDGPADVLLVNGTVAWSGQGRPPQAPERTLDAAGLVVAPGFIDLHCHLREPGQEDKETIASGTQAAARGGFTTVCAMPNTVPPVDNRALVEWTLERARAMAAVRVLPLACVTVGRRGKELAELEDMADAGAVGFSDDGDCVASSRLMRSALEYSRHLGLPVIDHCEDPELVAEGSANEGYVATRLGLRGRPAAAEEASVARDIALARLTGGRLHIAHLSTAAALEHVRRAKEAGLPVTAEVTPHHLTLNEERCCGWGWGTEASFLKVERVPRSASFDTSARVNPPLRTTADVKALRRALAEGLIDAIATDHAPHTVPDKLCEFDAAAPGISGLETAFGVALALVHRGELDLPTLIARLTVGPARVLGYGPHPNPLPVGEGRVRVAPRSQPQDQDPLAVS